MLTKRPATEDEVAKAKELHLVHNPGDDVESRLQTALDEGYKNETCSCGVTYLAFHHFTTCRKEDCPFSDGVSLLDRMVEQCEVDECASGGIPFRP